MGDKGPLINLRGKMVFRFNWEVGAPYLFSPFGTLGADKFLTLSVWGFLGFNSQVGA